MSRKAGDQGGLTFIDHRIHGTWQVQAAIGSISASNREYDREWSCRSVIINKKNARHWITRQTALIMWGHVVGRQGSMGSSAS